MVDAERVRRLLQHVTDGLTFLAQQREEGRDGLRRDPVRLPALNWYFVVTLEACIDAAQHVCASEGWGPPKTNADAMRVLARHRVFDPELGERMADAVGFRNLLVHQYADVGDDRVVAHLDELDDSEAFVAAVGRLIQT